MPLQADSLAAILNGNTIKQLEFKLLKDSPAEKQKSFNKPTTPIQTPMPARVLTGWKRILY